jgi:hypothetical protein
VEKRAIKRLVQNIFTSHVLRIPSRGIVVTPIVNNGKIKFP